VSASIFQLCRRANAVVGHFYPYPFANARQLGYFAVTVNAFWTGLLFVGLAVGATALDKRLASVATPTP
jgi:hypothetical protein